MLAMLETAKILEVLERSLPLELEFRERNGFGEASAKKH